MRAQGEGRGGIIDVMEKLRGMDRWRDGYNETGRSMDHFCSDVSVALHGTLADWLPEGH